MTPDRKVCVCVCQPSDRQTGRRAPVVMLPEHLNAPSRDWNCDLRAGTDEFSEDASYCDAFMTFFWGGG